MNNTDETIWLEKHVGDFAEALKTFRTNTGSASAAKLKAATEHLRSHLSKQCDLKMRMAVEALNFKKAASWRDKRERVLAWSDQPNDPQAVAEWTSMLTTAFPQMHTHIQAALAEPMTRTTETQASEYLWLQLERTAQGLIVAAIAKRRDMLQAVIATEDYLQAQRYHEQLRRLQILSSLETLPTESREWTGWLDEVANVLADQDQRIDVPEASTVRDLRQLAEELPTDLKRPAMRCKDI